MQTNYHDKEKQNLTRQIWNEFHTKLHSFISNRVNDVSAVDDILQDVFIKIHSQIDSLKDNNKIKGWIYQITRNAIVDYYRANKKMEDLPDILSTTELNPDSETRDEIGSCFLPMIRNLPQHYSQTLLLSEIKGLKQTEVAASQGISLAGVKKRIQRGRSLIKETLMEGCQFEFDRLGNIIDYDSEKSDCSKCK
jgi:RNA polymerase sigma-70 factor (ECF subfamily)